MSRKNKSRKVNLRVYELHGLTFVKVQKLITENSPWEASKELTNANNCNKLEYGKFRRFRKK